MTKTKRGLAWDRWEYLATVMPDREAIIHWDVLRGPYRWTYGCLHARATLFGGMLLASGVARGDACALILRHHADFYPLYMGVSAIGAIPAVLAYPNPRLHPGKFREGLSGMAARSGLHWILTEPELEPIVAPLTQHKKSSIKSILFPLTGREEKPNREAIRKSRAPVTPDEPLLLQHSSGTTGLQKAVVLSHDAVLGHIERYGRAIGLTGADKVVNWLPLYHDMGLIAAFHLPLASGIPSVQIDPFQWVVAPSLLCTVIAREKATLAWLPNFAYNFMADRVAGDDIRDVDLSSMRAFINCSEVVRPESHDRFFRRFARSGVKKEALSACYAMAEATFAVTQTGMGREAPRITVDRRALAKNIVDLSCKGTDRQTLVSSGSPIEGCAVKIVDGDGAELAEDRVGAVMIRSASLFCGYRNDPAKTAQAFKGGWYVSGDLGFFHQGEYYIIGRADDIITVAGKNIFPEDIENAVGAVPGIIPGRVVAFGREDRSSGTEDVCVAAETSAVDQKERASLERAVKRAGMDIDISITAVYLVPPRWLIKSSSGKLSRKTNKERLRDLRAP